MKMKNSLKGRILMVGMLFCIVGVLSAGGNQETTAIGDDGLSISIITYEQPLTEDATGTAVAFWSGVERFEGKFSDIKANLENVSHDNYATKLKTLAAANQLPDIYQVKGSWASDFIENDRMRPIDDMLDLYDDWDENMKEGAFSNFTFNGERYAVPNKVSSTFIYYNSAIFKECGFDEFPATWEGFLEAIDALKVKGYTPIAFGNKGNWYAESVWFSTLGNRFTGMEWYQSIRDHSGASFEDPEFIASLEAFQELALIGAFNSDLNSIDNNQLKTLYYNEKAAMFAEGTWGISDVVSNAPSHVLDATEVAVLPAVTGGKGDPNTITGGAGWGWAAASTLDDSKKEAVAGFLYEISSEDFAKEMLANNSVSPYAADDYDKSNLSPLTKKFNAMLEERDMTFIPVYDHQLSASVIDAMKVGIQELLIGTMTPEEVAASIQKEYVSE